MKLNSISPALTLLAATLVLGGCSRDGGSAGRTVIQNKGSDTLVNVAQAWAEHYQENESIAVAVSGGGSGTGISAMINGTVDIANASRSMKEEEKEAARKNGVEPIEHIVGFDALAVFVHKDNPIESITIKQLAAIYGEGGKATKWSDLGITIPGLSDDQIVLVGRQNSSGTYAYFRKTVLGKNGDYKLGSRDMHGSKDVVDLVSKTKGAIGYSGLAYATHEIKMVPVAKTADAPAVPPSPESALDGTYPIARPLFMITAGEPTGAVKEYMDWILSVKGQTILKDKGYAPVTALDS